MLQGREGVHFLGFREGVGSVFWVSGETFQPHLGAGRELGECSGQVWGECTEAVYTTRSFKKFSKNPLGKA